jgi:hypothetical protein
VVEPLQGYISKLSNGEKKNRKRESYQTYDLMSGMDCKIEDDQELHQTYDLISGVGADWGEKD